VRHPGRGGPGDADIGGHHDIGDNEALRRGRASRGGPRPGPGHLLGRAGGGHRVFNLLDGIAAIANSAFFIAGARFVVGDLRAWGWTMAIIGGVQLLAAVGVWAGNQLARWFAVAVVALNAIAQMFFIPAYPFWSLVIIAVDVVALWGLCAYGSRENLGVA
jgi:hypothetical protein